ncbi:hypothetical protein [Paenibacillus sp. IHBB 10380]|uniref:hypothetical protein n=1 Tax=Paenibacillus sp. IHBB 10380 TaxID=1566358 RepID=UPI0005CFA77A|nr:hypothetical protein [Paenibacillus sp. IHBB 10380]AJS60608.1 hypothetical protein UB51_21520 [Paenibacillus sp. IHBB 10380]
MNYSVLTYIEDLEPKYMNESTLFDEVTANLFDYYEQKMDSFRIGGGWKDVFVLKDGTRASYARIRDIDFAKMPGFCTHVVINREWNEIKYQEDSNFFVNYYQQFIESERDSETVLLILDCYKKEGRDSVADCILSIAQGHDHGAEDLLRLLTEGACLGEQAEVLRKLYVQTPNQKISQLWAFHCIQVGNLDAIKEIQDPMNVIKVFHPAGMSDRKLKHLNISEGIHPIILPWLEHENLAIRIDTARTISRFAENSHNITPYINSLEVRLYDHEQLKWHGQVSAYAASALYYSTISNETRVRALEILEDKIVDKDKKTSLNCTAAYTRFLIDKNDFDSIDELIKNKSKHVRTGVMKGLYAKVLSTDDVLERKRKGNKNIPMEEFDFSPVCERLLEGLKDDCQEVQKFASEALRDAACKRGLDITPAMPTLIGILPSGNSIISQNAIASLKNSIWKIDSGLIEKALVAIEILLQDNNKNVRQEAGIVAKEAKNILNEREQG